MPTIVRIHGQFLKIVIYSSAPPQNLFYYEKQNDFNNYKTRIWWKLVYNLCIPCKILLYVHKIIKGKVHEVDGLKSDNEAINNTHSQGRARALLFSQARAYPNLHVSYQQGRQKRARKSRGVHAPVPRHHRSTCVPLFIRIRAARKFLIFSIAPCVLEIEDLVSRVFWRTRSLCRGLEELDIVLASSK